MRALVTGAAGFVGANLVRRLLADGHDVHVVLRPDSDPWRLRDIWPRLLPVHGDLTDASSTHAALAEAEPEWVFHLAAHGAYPTQRDHSQILQTNVQGTAHLLLAARAAGARAFVHAGSSSEYGLKDHAPNESEALDPNSTYAVAKAAATLLCRQFARETSLPTVTLRLYSVFGPFEEPSRLMPTLATHLMRGVLPPLTTPNTARDFVYVDDVTDAFIRAAERADATGAIFNIGSGRQTSLATLVQQVRHEFEIVDEPRWATMASRSWDTTSWIADPRLARERLGWCAQTELIDGLRALVGWLRTRSGEAAARYGLSAT
ncbi:MAG: NAD-dependent epimerase/dehydratase family protein [Chloroflexota bacterium]